MSDFFASGRVADLILCVMVVEALVLVILHLRTGQGLHPTAFLGNLIAGVGLVLALRGALLHAGWIWIALALAVALVGHGVDLWGRWKGG